MTPQYYTISEAAERMGRCSRTIRRWIQSGLCPAPSQVGARGTLLFPRKPWDAFERKIRRGK